MKIKSIIGILCLCLCLLIAPAAAAGGSGTPADPYRIETVAELQSIQNDLTAYYVLANDINLDEVQFTPIGSTTTPFIGSFDGSGYTISNWTISYSTQNTGFFRCLGPGAVVKDVTFQDCTVTTSSSRCGLVIGSIIMSPSAHETAVISDVDCVRCSISSTTSITACTVSLITSYSVVKIVDCDISYCNVDSGGSSNGGLVSSIQDNSSVEITKCNVDYSYIRGSGFTSGSLVSTITTSSLVFIDSSVVRNSIIESLSGGFVGGIAAECRSLSSTNVVNCDVENCIVKGSYNIGGIIGVCSDVGTTATAQMCTVTGCTIVATSNIVGGIAGRCTSGTTSNLTGCTVTDSTIIAPNKVAGISPLYI